MIGLLRIRLSDQGIAPAGSQGNGLDDDVPRLWLIKYAS
jgi:hypothetical protein